MDIANKLLSVNHSYAIDIDPDKMGGTPVLHGTRIPVSLVLANIADDVTIDEIAEDYCLPKDKIVDSLKWLQDILSLIEINT